MEIESNKPYIFNLLNGMEIIGKITSSDQDFYFLENAFLFVQGKDKKGEIVVDLYPPNFQFGKQEEHASGNTLKLAKTSLVYIYEPNPAWVEIHTRRSSPIILAAASPFLN